MNQSDFLKKTVLASAVFMLGAASVSAQDVGDLEEVTVFAQKVPYRGDVPLESLPQQVQVLSSDILVQTGKVEFQNAMDLASGLARQNSFGGLWDSFAIRGFAGDENLPAAYLINGFSGGRGYSGNRDTSNIESIEILKGPGSALYGRGEPGGTVNVITKKPQFEKEGYVKASAGRFTNYRLEGDYTNAVSDTVAFRINGSYKDADSFRDHIDTKKLVLTPSVLVRFTDSTSLNYELEYLSQETPFDRGIVAVDYDPEVVDISSFYGEPQDGPIEIEAVGHQFLLQQDLANDWSLLAGLGYRESSFEGQSSDTDLSGSRQILTNTTLQAANGVGPNQFVNREIRVRDYEAEDLSVRLELTGTFETGSLTHHLLVGMDAYAYELETVQARYRDGGGSATYFVNIFEPVYGQAQNLLNGPPLSFRDRLEEQDNKGFYIQDQIDVSEQWKVLFGVRYDDFTQDVTNQIDDTVSSNDTTATSPRAGIVFEPTDAVSFYASYGEGFRPNGGADVFGNTFDPEESESYEIGMKFELLGGALSSTIALFQMEKSNILTLDPVNGGSAALGAAESEGLEFDISGQLTDTLNLAFNYAYVDAKSKNEVINRDWWVTVPAGNPLINIPENSANLTMVKNLQIGDSPATIGFTVNYVDKRLGETIDPDYFLPSYTLLNLFGTYEMNENLTFSMHLDNVTDETYYANSYHKWWTAPGAPVTYTVGLTYSFD